MKGQKHGKQFEDALKALLFPGASDKSRKPTETFDIEAEFDRALGLSTSVKASKGCVTVALADARRFWNIDTPYRLMVACWRQKSKNVKEFYDVHEFIMHGEILSQLRGAVSYNMIEGFHDGLGVKHFPQGQHIAARQWAKVRKKEIEALGSLLILNPKIDSKTQRRLQCSVKLSTLKRLADECPVHAEGVANHVVHRQSIGDMILPLSIKSEPRQFSKSATAFSV
jgi:hypothetical protein